MILETITMGSLISTGLLLGLGLTMDACAVSMANGMQEPNMKKGKMTYIAFMYGFFQALMPLIGYFCGNALYTNIPQIKEYHLIPITALVILLFLGIKMIIDGIKDMKDEKEREKEIREVRKSLTFKVIFIQTIATSIDALSSGLSFSNYFIWQALIVVGLVMLVTFVASFMALIIGKKFGVKLGNYALILGGIILCSIGLEIFITGMIG